MIVVDGQNVAIRHGKDHFSAQGLQITADYWQQKGHKVIILLPDYFFKTEEVEKKQASLQNAEQINKKLPDNI